MSNSTAPLSDDYQLVFLLSDLGFPVSSNLFGQLTIAINLCRLIPKILKNADIYILTSGKCTNTSIGKNIHVTQVNDPFLDHSAYKLELEKILKNKKSTIATSFMIHRDAAAVYEISKLKKSYSNLRLIVGLYCTAGEYFYDELQIQDHLSPQAKDYISTKNLYTANVKKYLAILLNEKSIDKYLVINKYTKKTYLSKEVRKLIPTEKIYIIGSGEDKSLFKPVTNKQAKLIRKKYIFDENEFLLCYSTRFTQYKGSDIMEKILDHYNNCVISPTFLFPLYPSSDTILLLKGLLKYKELLKNKKIKFFLELYRQKYLLNIAWPVFHKEACLSLTNFIKGLPDQSRKYVENNYLGILDFPYYNLVNLVIRPSIADSQAITLFESALCNCPTIGTERVGFYHDIKALKKYAIKLPDSLKIFNRYSDYKTPNYNRSVKLVTKKFISMIEKERKKFADGLDPEDTRTLILKNGFTSDVMVKRHISLYKSLFAID